MPDTHRAVIAAHIRIGSRYEDSSNNGISHFLEHMLYRGTEEHPSAHELAVAFESFGGSLTATTSSDTGTLEVSVPPAHLMDVLPLFAKVFKAPSFSAIDIERGIVSEEILEGLDDNGNCVSSDDLIRDLMFPEHPLGQPISGTLDHLRSFDVPSLRAHHARFYCGSNAAIAIAGPLDVEVAANALQAVFESIPRGQGVVDHAPRATEGPLIRKVSHHSSQTEVTLGFRAPGFLHEDEAAMDLLCRILDDGMSTRLYHQLCDERGLCYDVSGGYESYTDSGLLELCAETGHGRVAAVVEQLLAMVSDLRENGPTEAELTAAKRRYRWQLESMLDSPTQVAEYFLTEHLVGTSRPPLKREERLLAVTREQVRAVAQRWLSRKNLGLVLVGFPKKSEFARVEALVDRF